MLRCLVVSVSFTLLAACASPPAPEARSQLQFLDIPSFNAELHLKQGERGKMSVGRIVFLRKGV